MIDGFDPRTGSPTGFSIEETALSDVDAACRRAVDATSDPVLRDEVSRAGFLRSIAVLLERSSETLVSVADRETALGEVRLRGEVKRTAWQLNLMADVVLDGAHLEVAIDTADPAAPVAPRPDLRRIAVPLGPVAVFAASNFPFAFSVAGGDTGSALAAGCPVIVKAHPSHPETSECVADLVREAVASAGASPDLLTVVHGLDAGIALAEHPSIEAVAFTGSTYVGRMLHDRIAARQRPVPFYGELGSVNPVIVTPGAISAREDEIADGLFASFTLGTGQFCTKPGVVLCPRPNLDSFSNRLRHAVSLHPGGLMLNAGMQRSYHEHIAAVEAIGAQVTLGRSPMAGYGVPACLTVVAVEQAVAAPAVLREHFGPSCVVVPYDEAGEACKVLDLIGGSLTVTFHAQPDEHEAVRALLEHALRYAGRVIWNGFPTGVSVAWAMQHGGPYPSSTAPATTSVGSAAIRRFVRAVSFQSMPIELLPPSLRPAAVWPSHRRLNGVLGGALGPL